MIPLYGDSKYHISLKKSINLFSIKAYELPTYMLYNKLKSFMPSYLQILPIIYYYISILVSIIMDNIKNNIQNTTQGP